MGTTVALQVDDKGSLLANIVKPLSSARDARLELHMASLDKPIITGGTLSDVEAIQTASLVVGTGVDKNKAIDALDVKGNANVDGSLHVHGSVVGSGPYMDSSDARFKTDVHTIKNALGKVTNLNAVSEWDVLL